MFKAKMNKETVNLLKPKIHHTRDLLKSNSYKDNYKCPVCNKPVILSWAEQPKKVPHFKHKLKENCIYGSGESEEHIKGKKLLFNYFNNLLQHKARVEIEQFIPETGQIADVLIEFSNGVRWAVEYQRSNISADEIINRRNLYKSENIQDIWIAGENMISNRDFHVCGIKGAAQNLVHKGISKTTSLITLNAEDQSVSIFRGLSRMNTRSFTFEEYYEHDLDDIAFNLYGQPFCIEDYKLASSDFKENRSELEIQTELKELKKARVQASNYFTFELEDSKNPQNKMDSHIKIDYPLKLFIPVEMKGLVLSFFSVYDHGEPFEGTMFIPSGLYTSRWKKIWDIHTSKHNTNTMSFMEQEVKNWMLKYALQDIYSQKFQTTNELEKEIEIFEDGATFIPFSQANYHLQKHGLIDEPFEKDKLGEVVKLEECLFLIMRLIDKNVQKNNVINIAIQKGVLFSAELESPFTNDLLNNIVIRAKKFITESPNYHKAYKEGYGMFSE